MGEEEPLTENEAAWTALNITSAKEPELWGMEGDEYLNHTEMDVAIEAELDGCDKLTGTLVICGYARYDKPKAEKWGDDILENLLERLDEDYGPPEDSTDKTDAMKEAAKVFVQAVLDEYLVWRCEVVERKTIDVPEWVKANRPDWLKQE